MMSPVLRFFTWKLAVLSDEPMFSENVTSSESGSVSCPKVVLSTVGGTVSATNPCQNQDETFGAVYARFQLDMSMPRAWVMKSVNVPAPPTSVEYCSIVRVGSG